MVLYDAMRQNGWPKRVETIVVCRANTRPLVQKRMAKISGLILFVFSYIIFINPGREWRNWQTRWT